MKTSKKPQKRRFRKLNKSVDSKPKHVKFRGMNGDNPNDSLELLRAKYEQEIQDALQRVRVLRAKLANIGELAQESKSLKAVEAAESKYVGWGTTEAILDAARRLWNSGKGTNNGVTASQI